MVLDKLGSSLRATLQKVTSSLFVDEKLINEIVKEIQRALLQADTNVKLVFEVSNKIKERAKQATPAGITKREHLIKAVYEELTNFLGTQAYEIKIDKQPTKIMLVGLFGNGKTTTTGKLAKYYKKRGLKVAVIQTDTWRPAAYDQLEQLAKQVGVDFYGDKSAKDPAAIYKKYEKELEKYDVAIIDTAGRDALSDELVEELTAIHAAVQADEKLLVLAADLGQAAQKQAQTFHDTCGVTGVIVTKLEGTAKGGGALSACAVTDASIAFVGVGEKIDDLEVFHPERFVGRLLGMGDLETLLEKAKEVVSEKDAEKMKDKFLRGEFTLLDLYEQMQSMKKMGSFKKLLGMIPGMSQLQLPKEALDVQEGKLEKWKYVMDSCTQQELEEPQNIKSSQIERIAAGSGTSIKEVKELLKQHKQAKKMMKMFKGGSEKDMAKMMKRMGGNMPKGLR